MSAVLVVAVRTEALAPHPTGRRQQPPSCLREDGRLPGATWGQTPQVGAALVEPLHVVVAPAVSAARAQL